MDRRTVLAGLAATGAGLATTDASALHSSFASDPLSRPDRSGRANWGSRPQRGRPAPLPLGYQLMGQRFGVPPIVLYGVALQESAKLFGPFSLPWPWTLNVRGEPMRYPSYAAAVAGMHSFIAAGVRNIDTCLMQVNWGYHSDKLLTVERALNPYPNIAVGAQILRRHHADTHNWYSAVGRYHSPADAARAANYAALVYRRISQVPASQPQPTAAGASNG